MGNSVKILNLNKGVEYQCRYNVLNSSIVSYLHLSFSPLDVIVLEDKHGLSVVILISVKCDTYGALFRDKATDQNIMRPREV